MPLLLFRTRSCQQLVLLLLFVSVSRFRITCKRMLFLCSSLSLLTLRVPKFIHLSWNTSLEVGMAPPPLRGQSGSSGKWGRDTARGCVPTSPQTHGILQISKFSE